MQKQEENDKWGRQDVKSRRDSFTELKLEHLEKEILAINWKGQQNSIESQINPHFESNYSIHKQNEHEE